MLNLMIISSFSAERFLSSILLNEVGRGWVLRVSSGPCTSCAFGFRCVILMTELWMCRTIYKMCPACNGRPHVLQYTHTMACPSYLNHGNCTSHFCWNYIFLFSSLPPASFTNLSLSSSEEEKRFLLLPLLTLLHHQQPTFFFLK